MSRPQASVTARTPDPGTQTYRHPAAMRLLALCLLAALAPLAHAQPSAAPEAAPLTDADVRTYLRLLLAQTETVREAEAELGPLDDDTNGPLARQRVEARFAQEGTTVAAFQALDRRIRDAASAIETEAELAELNAEMEAAIAEMADLMTAEQLAEARAGLAQNDAETQATIDATRPDWPAVRPHLPTLTHLEAYAAGNRSDPPVLR